jgi:hypothetical protein
MYIFSKFSGMILHHVLHTFLIKEQRRETALLHYFTKKPTWGPACP